jgi:GPI-anchor transamidase subunit K
MQRTVPSRARRLLQIWYWLLCRLLPFLVVATAIDSTKPQHSSNYAVIVSTSRYWFNYRHNTNALLLYQYLRTYGNFTDENIILMLADEYALNPRNPLKNQIFNTATDSVPAARPRRNIADVSSSLFTDDIEIDYRGEDVTVENFIHVLTGRREHRSGPAVLRSDSNSHILLYMTGHAGDLFFKFQDVEEITSSQLADALEFLHVSGRYREILFIADTCQAFTMGDAIVERKLPNVSVIGSSLRGESSYAHSGHPVLGLATVEKYTHFLMDFVARQTAPHSMSLAELLVAPFNSSKQTNMLGAHVGMDDSNSVRKLSEVPWNDFFANVQGTEQSTPVDARWLPDVTTISSSPWWIDTAPTTATNSARIEPQYVGKTINSVPLHERKCTTPRLLLEEVPWTLEPNHPMFVLLMLSLGILVALGSRYC